MTSYGNPYDVLAPVYARALGSAEAHRLLPFLEAALLAALRPGAVLLDVCCGSGQLARLLAGRGFRLTAIDSSRRMIEEARSLDTTGAVFLAADARSFRLASPHDGALCTFNSLAHFSPRELPLVFLRIAQALRPGARLVFDVYLEEAYQRRWQGEFSLSGAGLRGRVRPRYNSRQRLAVNEISFAGSVCTVVTQYCHPAAQIEYAFRNAGFELLARWDGERDLQMPDESGRAFYLVWKRLSRNVKTPP